MNRVALRDIGHGNGVEALAVGFALDQMVMRGDVVEATVVVEDRLVTNRPVTPVGGFNVDFGDRTLWRKPLLGESRFHGNSNINNEKGFSTDFFVKNSGISPSISTGNGARQRHSIKSAGCRSAGCHFMYLGPERGGERLELAGGNHRETPSDVLFLATAGRRLGRGGAAPDRGLGMEPLRRHRLRHVWGPADRLSRHTDQIEKHSVTQEAGSGTRIALSQAVCCQGRLSRWLARSVMSRNAI
jgi:hypothetical protein